MSEAPYEYWIRVFQPHRRKAVAEFRLRGRGTLQEAVDEICAALIDRGLNPGYETPVQKGYARIRTGSCTIIISDNTALSDELLSVKIVLEGMPGCIGIPK